MLIESRERGFMIARFDVGEKHTWRAINLIAVFWNKSNDQRDKICWKNYRSNTNQIPSGARAHDDYALHILFRMQFLSSFSVFTEIKIKLD